MILEMLRLWIICIFAICWRLNSTGATSVEVNIFPTYPAGYVIRRVGDILNITCTVNSSDGSSIDNFQLSWMIPSHHFSGYYLPVPAGSHVTADDHKAVTLVINPLMESDSGLYICRALRGSYGQPNSTIVQANVTVKLKPKKGSCSLPFFQCASQECLAPRYVCDGKKDCKDGFDEDRSHCGEDPCLGKVYCHDGRCRTPEFCCDSSFEIICQVDTSHHCCRKKQPNMWPELSDHQKKYDSDMGFLQSTIYTIIGCAVAFIFVVTIMVVAVCRVHMKQNAMTTPTTPRALLPLSRTPYWSRRLNMDGPGVRGGGMHPPSTSLLVTYNINNGVQLVGHFTDPPPYSEAAADPPPIYGPPPPYVSSDDLHRQPESPVATRSQPETETTQSTVQINNELT